MNKPTTTYYQGYTIAADPEAGRVGIRFEIHRSPACGKLFMVEISEKDSTIIDPYTGQTLRLAPPTVQIQNLTIPASGH